MHLFLVEPTVCWMCTESNSSDYYHFPNVGQVQHLKHFAPIKAELYWLGSGGVCVGGRYEMTCTLFRGGFPAEENEEDSGGPSQERGLLSQLLPLTAPSHPVFRIILPQSTFVVGHN